MKQLDIMLANLIRNGRVTVDIPGIEHIEAEGETRSLNTSQTRILSTTAQIRELAEQRGAAVSLMRDETADFILKFAPIITAAASLLYVAGALVINLLIQ